MVRRSGVYLSAKVRMKSAQDPWLLGSFIWSKNPGLKKGGPAINSPIWIKGRWSLIKPHFGVRLQELAAQNMMCADWLYIDYRYFIYIYTNDICIQIYKYWFTHQCFVWLSLLNINKFPNNKWNEAPVFRESGFPGSYTGFRYIETTWNNIILSWS